jgi:hypothetical protein
MDNTVASTGARRINWQSVITVVSAAILIGAEVFGAAYAGGWAVAGLLDLGMSGVYVLQVIFFLCGVAVMAQFIRSAQRVEPFTTRR